MLFDIYIFLRCDKNIPFLKFQSFMRELWPFESLLPSYLFSCSRTMDISFDLFSLLYVNSISIYFSTPFCLDFNYLLDYTSLKEDEISVQSAM